ncbi:MAG TPA: NlpC/P60 family protein [Solirubrobacterales bacterium]|nr:NlpC/P60 family protein [Solirubrobacterales bacterium]
MARRLRRHRRVTALIAIVAIAAGAAYIAVPQLTGDSGTEAGKLAAVKVAPEPWAGHAKPNYQSERALEELAPWDRPPPKAAPAPIDPKTGMPAASAGTNGSFTPPPPSERRHVYSATHPVGGVPSALLLNRTALAPPSAPDPIRQMISAANLIVGQPYRWGGGHGSFQSKGYDCSGAVSYALAGAGLIRAPLTSGQFMSFGIPGPGRWLTIYANPGHVYAVIAGLRWDTVGDARGSGPRWHPLDAYPSGFEARHLPGL